MLEKKSIILLTNFSNLNTWKEDESLEKLILILENYKLEVLVSQSLLEYRSHLQKARDFNILLASKEINFIFDLSGGDSSNALLEYIDWDLIRKKDIIFFGMSDLTVFLNSILAKTGKITGHFMLKNIFNKEEKFYKEFFLKKKTFSDIPYYFLKGNRIEPSTLVGGNIRCFLKLAGTEYMPQLNNNILFLESLSGNWHRIETMLNHLKHLGAFNKIKGLLLGEFSQLEGENKKLEVENLFLNYFKEYKFPIVKSDYLGHGRNKGLIYIGELYKF